jgi:hypothetical protein
MTDKDLHNSEHVTVRCDCGKMYHVAIEAAGKKVKCTCGRVIAVPAPTSQNEAKLKAHNVESTKQTARQEPQTKPVSKETSIRYKCWTCGSDMESSKSRVGQRETCTQCETPNLVPQPNDIQTSDVLRLCHFCRKKVAEPSSTLWKDVQLGLKKPSYRCRRCGATWEEVPRVKGSDYEVHSYQPHCPSCIIEDNKVVPTELPAMPVGKFYKDFHSTGIVQYAGGWRSLVLQGSVGIPRCQECKRIHETASGIMGFLAFIIGAMVFIVIVVWWGFLHTRNLIEFAQVMFLSFILAVFSSLLVLVIMKCLLYPIVKAKTSPTGAAKRFFAVEKLRQQGWTL